MQVRLNVALAHRLVRPQDAHRFHGQGLVEYALILMLIAMVTVAILSAVGRSTGDTFARISCSMDGKTYHADNGNGNSNRCR